MTSPIAVDGVLDEAAWDTAPAVTEFLKFTPTDGGAPPGRTEVRFLQDDKALYVGIRVLDAGYAIRARVSARERINADDQVGIYLDTFKDGRSGYIFYLNPLGVQQDIRHNSGNWNPNWDVAFRSAGHVTETGFEVEVAFPWRSLKFPPSEGAQTWGLILTRKVPHEGAKYAYPDISRSKPLLFSEEAELVGVRPPRRGSGLEIIPALTAGQLWSPDDPRPFDELDLSPWWMAVRPSLDLRFGITPDIGLASTVNPDFSQVESDLADVRLNARFAFQFTERRPFFLDGVDLYQDQANTLYSRSIAEPVYGLKLSGREGPLSIGLLHALDQSPLASVHEESAPGFDAEDVEDRLGQNTLARLRLDAFGGGWIGLTMADKRILGTSARPGRGGAHDSAGLDLGVPFADRWLATANAFASLTEVPGAESIRGVSAGTSVVRSSDIGTGGGFEVVAHSPGVRQELGFMNQSGLVSGAAFIDHTFTPEGVVDTYKPEAWVWVFEEFDGDRVRELGTAHSLLVNGVTSMWTRGQLVQRRQTGETVNGWVVAGGGFTQLGRLIEVGGWADAFRSLDFGTLGPALTVSGNVDATLRTSRTRLDLSANVSRHAPDGQGVELGRRIRGTLSWQATRGVGTRLLVQEGRRFQAEGVQHDLVISPLLTVLDVPGTAAFVGWTERIDLIGRRTVDRSLFAKVSVLLRP
ncbi:MAG: carbohydrate binding family 9 domain-containing protein [Myxococcales bacterium]|nr:carbohydrate binding family 9 domain-containing protein [Myxococcales bacterium]